MNQSYSRPSALANILLEFIALITIALSVASVGMVNASTVQLTVSVNTDTPSSYPGGQTASSGSTSGDLRYCINYILNEQAQGIANDYNIVFASGVTSIQLQAKLSIVNLLGSSTIVIGNPDPGPAVTITGGSAGTGSLFIRQGTVTLQNLNFQNLNATGGSGGPGGGGGMGAGGALFIDTANVTLHNVNFTNCSATAGLGSSGSGGGGGGLGGNGGGVGGYGGGGGYGGNGGDSRGGGGGAGGNGGSNLGGGGGAILGTTGGIGGTSPTEAMLVAPYISSIGFDSPFVVGGGGYGSNSNNVGGTGAGGTSSSFGGLGGSDGNTTVGGTGGNAGLPQTGGSGNGGSGGSTSTTTSGSLGATGQKGGTGGGGGMY